MSKRLSFRADIQGLRAIAVLAVMLFHANRQVLPGGFVGVDVFFVISGFLITAILLKQKESADFSFILTLKQFYIGRIKRIAPAYYMLLAVVTIIGAIILIPKDYQFFHESLHDSLWFASNQYFASFGNYFAPKSDELPLLHTWSLAIEIQFYLLYPFFILLVKKAWLKKIIAILIIVLFGICAYQLNERSVQGIYYGLYARIPEFLIGGSVVLFAKNFKKLQSKWLPAIGLVLITASFVFINDKTPFPGLYAIPSVVGTALVLTYFAGESIFSRILSLPVLVWVGAISYSLYLWHWPILAFTRYISGSYELTFGQSVVYWGGTFILATLSYYFIEQWFRQKQDLKLSGKLSWLSLFVFVVLITTVSQRLNKEIVTPLPVEFTRYADPATICHGKIVGDCLRGDRNSTKKPILVLGDSHAAMLNHFFDVIGKEYHLSFKIVSSFGCITIPNFDYKRIASYARQACLEQIEQVRQILSDFDQVVIVGMWNKHLKYDGFRRALHSFISVFSDKEILLLADTPSFRNYNPIRSHRLSKIGLNFQIPEIEHNVSVANNELKIDVAQKYRNASYLDLAANINLNKIPTNAEKLMYIDTHHFSEIGSRLYASLAKNLLKSYFDNWLN